MYRGHLGLSGSIGGLVLGAGNFFFTLGMLYSSIANVLVIGASASLFAAIGSFIIFGEVILLRTLITIAVCIACVGLIFNSDVSGSGNEKQLLGNTFAVFRALFQAAAFVAIRYRSSFAKRE